MTDIGGAQRSGRLSPLLVIGVILQLLLVLVSPYMAFVSGIRSDACDDDCDFDVIGLGSGLAVGGPIVIAVIVLVLAVVARRRWVVWLPYAGIVATFGWWWVAFAVADAGLPGGSLTH